jgi:hypothetical protein
MRLSNLPLQERSGIIESELSIVVLHVIQGQELVKFSNLNVRYGPSLIKCVVILDILSFRTIPIPPSRR